jgi:hypothetical protein
MQGCITGKSENSPHAARSSAASFGKMKIFHRLRYKNSVTHIKTCVTCANSRDKNAKFH